jgi:hypothetical protein
MKQKNKKLFYYHNLCYHDHDIFSFCYFVDTMSLNFTH